MTYPMLTSLLLTVLSLPAWAITEPASDLDAVQIKSAEFQYDKPFQSPQRLSSERRYALLDGSRYAPLTSTSTFTDKNAALKTQVFDTKNRMDSTAIVNNGFSIFDSWVTLDIDRDFDGYYSKFTVEFDADTVYERAYVYAVIYLGTNDIFDAVHVTSVFAINGDSSNDSFVVESELVSGFPTDDYEIMVELYDADSDLLVAFTDGFDDADLAYTPLESQNYESLPTDRVIIVEEYGGSLGLLGILALLIVNFWRQKA